MQLVDGVFAKAHGFEGKPRPYNDVVVGFELERPRVESARLSGMPDCYKIKLKSAGYRLVYQVEDRTVTVVVVAVGRRERNFVYKIAVKRV